MAKYEKNSEEAPAMKMKTVMVKKMCRVLEDKTNRIVWKELEVPMKIPENQEAPTETIAPTIPSLAGQAKEAMEELKEKKLRDRMVDSAPTQDSPTPSRRTLGGKSK